MECLWNYMKWLWIPLGFFLKFHLRHWSPERILVGISPATPTEDFSTKSCLRSIQEFLLEKATKLLWEKLLVCNSPGMPSGNSSWIIFLVNSIIYSYFIWRFQPEIPITESVWCVYQEIPSGIQGFCRLFQKSRLGFLRNFTKNFFIPRIPLWKFHLGCRPWSLQISFDFFQKILKELLAREIPIGA